MDNNLHIYIFQKLGAGYLTVVCTRLLHNWTNLVYQGRTENKVFFEIVLCKSELIKLGKHKQFSP